MLMSTEISSVQPTPNAHAQRSLDRQPTYALPIIQLCAYKYEKDVERVIQLTRMGTIS